MRNITILAGALIVGAMLLNPIIHFATMDEVQNVTIQDKERINTTDSSKYLIFTDKETFENVDSLWAFKFNSSDVYGKIPVNGVCSFTVTGFRIPLFSSYRNILKASC